MKKGSKFKAKNYLLLPHQVAEYITPLHVGLTLLPLGLYTRDNANALIRVINLVAMDAASKNGPMMDVAYNCGSLVRKMLDRVAQGKSWNVTTEERKLLQEYTVKMDRYFRQWTTHRLLAAAATVDHHNNLAKEKGLEFGAWVEVKELKSDS